jgi:hypothetical protein
VSRAIWSARIRASPISRPALLISRTVGSSTDSGHVAIKLSTLIQGPSAAHYAGPQQQQPSARDARFHDAATGRESVGATPPVAHGCTTR